MEINSLSCLFFSPTGTTRKIVEAIAQGIQPGDLEMIDCTQTASRENVSSPIDSDAVILAAPVYYGRLPESIVPVLKHLEGDGKPVILVVVYGNREYDDALLELYDISQECGFIPVAAGAFVAEHSYSIPGRPMAEGRPDSADIEKAVNFGKQIMEKLQPIESADESGLLRIPGNHPYKKPENLYMIKKVRETTAFTPETDTEHCTQCGTCVEECPEAAIDSCDVTDIDRWKCILCFACIKSCPEQAKNMTDDNFNAAVGQLAKAIQSRKEPDLFLMA